MAAVRGPNNEPYGKFFNKWSDEQQQLCKELLDGLNSNMGEDELRGLVEKVEKHYREYYRAKDGATKQDVLKMMQPSWRSPLENAFLWIGGWRPTMVFRLAYAEAGQQIEAELAEFLNGLDTPNMASLTSKQLEKISGLQVRTQKSEEELGHQQAIIQQSLADEPLLSLAQADHVGETLGLGGQGSMGEAMEDKVKGLEELMRSADELRVESLQEFLKVLTTVQAAQYVVAAGELFMALRRLGKKKADESSVGNGETHEESN